MKKVFIPMSDMVHMSEAQYGAVLRMSGIDLDREIKIQNALDGNYYSQEEPKPKLMNLKEFMHLQAGLDNIIMDRAKESRKEITNSELLSCRLLALFTEVGEFCNELGSFKYWKQNHEVDEEKSLEEFADVLFFVFSIANLKGYTAEQIQAAYMDKWNENIHRQKNNY